VLRRSGVDPAEAIRRARSGRLPGWPPADLASVRDSRGLAEQAVRQWFEVHVRQPRWPLGLPSVLVRRLWTAMVADPAYDDWCSSLAGRTIPLDDDPTRMPRTWEAACHAERLDPHRPAHLPVLFLVDQALQVDDGLTYTSRCTGRVCRVFPPEVCVRHAFAPTRGFTTYRADSGTTRPA
jgi:hypothetical protein